MCKKQRIMLYSDKEFEKIWQKIINNDNFALVDFDNELMTSKYYADFINSSENIHDLLYALPCICCNREDYYRAVSRIPKNANATISNLFSGSNYKKFISKFSKLTRKAILITDNKSESINTGALEIIKTYEVSEGNDDFIKIIIEETKTLKNVLFVVSAKEKTAKIIMELLKNNPDNAYIDFGNSLSGQNTGLQKKCRIPDNKLFSTDVSVVLNLYKRPENLEKQFEVIENQSLKPREIILFKDETNPSSNIVIPEAIKDKFSFKITTSENIGVWGRFSAALLAKSTYVCVFDDDTMPGRRWLENCHYSMLQKEGLYGTIGILLTKPKKYPLKKVMQIGWANPNEEIAEVDFVGHSWFFKRDWLGALWIDSSNLYKFKLVGEDMFFSKQIKKYLGLPTFVPPHPKDKTEFYGSIPELGHKLGSSDAGVSVNPENLYKMNEAINVALKNGFKPLLYRNIFKYLITYFRYN